MRTYRTTIRGKKAWVADHGTVNGKRRRRFFATREQAEADLETVELQRRTAGDVWVGMSAGERLEAAQVIAECRSLNVTLREVMDHFRDGAKQVPQETVTLGAAVDKILESKRGNGHRRKYLENLKYSLGAFRKGREQVPIHSVTVSDVEGHLGTCRSPWSRKTALRRVGTLFSFSVRRGWVKENPVDRIDGVRIEQKPPRILSVRQAAHVMVWTRKRYPKGLAAATLALFAGVRPYEILGIRWDHLNLDDGVLVIDSAASKVGLRRIVHLEPAAIEWLKVAKKAGAKLPLKKSAWRTLVSGLSEHFGWSGWPADILRHTAASFLLAHKRDAGAVALELGHSIQILFRHYRELVTRKDAARFWSLIPRIKGSASPEGSIRLPLRNSPSR